MLRVMVSVALVLFAWIVISPALPWLEGRYYPVTDRAEFTSVRESRPGWTEIAGHLTKLRGCDFDAVRVYLGSLDGGRARAQINFLETAKNRPQGEFAFGPWEIQLTREQFERNSFAVAVHSCHPYWVTKTIIWSNTGG